MARNQDSAEIREQQLKEQLDHAKQTGGRNHIAAAQRAYDRHQAATRTTRW